MAVTYTGLRGIKTAADEALDSLKSNDEILGMGITGLKNKRFNEFWRHWSNKRIKKKIQARHIFSESDDYFNTFKKIRYTKTRTLSGITPVAVDIFGNDKVLLLNYDEPVSCILLYGENVAASFKQFFEQLWKMAK